MHPISSQTFEDVLYEALSDSQSTRVDGSPVVLEELGRDIAARLASVGIDPASQSTDGKKTVTTYEVSHNIIDIDY